MAEVATLNQVVQIGVETTPGTGVAANKRLNSLSIEPAVQADINRFRPMGGKFPTVAALGREWVEARLSGALTYTEIVYPLSSVLRAATPVQISPPTGQAYRWTFTPAQAAEDPIKTFTVEHGSAARARKFVYGIVRDLGISITRERIELSGAMLGRQLQDGITMTASPTEIALVPVLPAQVDVYLDNTAAGIGTTKLLRALAAELSITNRYALVWVLDSTQSSFVAHVEIEPAATLRLVLEADAQGMALLSAMRNGDKRFVRVQATGPNIETGNNYTFKVDMCGIVSEAGAFSDEDGVYAVEWTLHATYDASWAKALEVEVVNTVSAL